MGKSFDFVAIGDITTDAFIRLKDAEVHCDINKEKCQICLSFKDKVPYEFVKVVRAVGNAANAAVSASRLGLSAAFVTNIGNDQNGKECLEALGKEGVATDFVKMNDGVNTNYHYVLWYGDDRTILIKHEKFAYEMQDIGEPKWVYLSSAAENSLDFHDALAAYLENHPMINLAFQPGTYQIKFGHERLSALYKRAKVFLCNKEESQKILNSKEEDMKTLAENIRKLGPEIVVLTDGPNGAYMLNNKDFWFIEKFPDEQPPYERTGAGDAFSSAFVSALALGKMPEEALCYGTVNSMSVVQYIGAQEGLLSQTKLEEYLEKSPDYRPRKI